MALKAVAAPLGSPVGGTGTTNTIPRWTGASTLGDSVLVQSGTSIGVNVTPAQTFHAYFASGNNGIRIESGTNTAADYAVLRFTQGGGEKAVLYTNLTQTVLKASAGTLDLWGSGSNGIRVDTTGNVGIGTASPLSIAGVGLTVYGATNGAFYLQNSSNNSRIVSNGNDVYIDAGAGGTGGAVVFRRSSSVTESARIDSSGRWLVGTSTAPAGSGIMALVGNATRSGMEWNDNTGGFAIIPSGANNANLYAVSGGPGAETYTQIGAFTNTSLNISTQSGYGLKLPATPGNTDPNTLDCYADGGTANSGGVTWTPTLTFDGLSTGITYSTQVGRYTRIGNMIYATAYISLTSKGTATGDARIAGLPTSSNTAGLYPSAAIGTFSNITTIGQLCGYMQPNSGGVLLNQVSAAGAVTNMKDTNFTNTSGIAISICYPVT